MKAIKAARDANAARIRHALLERFGAGVRRRRRFEVDLFDPTALEESWKVEIFREFHRRTLRPWLENVASCKIFQEPPNPLAQDFLDRVGAKLARRGARPAEWLARYVKARGEEKHLMLTPEVLDDELFWWWALTQPSRIAMVFLVPCSEFDWVGFFRGVYDPQQYGGSRPTTLRVALKETKRNAMVAFLLSSSLTASVVASSPNVEKLFRLAVEHATLTPQLETLAFVRRARRLLR